MSVSDLVQVGSDLWVQKDDVVRIYRTDERSGGLVYVVFEEHNNFTDKKSRCYRNTDWPIERVVAALGLVDATGLDEMWNR